MKIINGSNMYDVVKKLDLTEYLKEASEITKVEKAIIKTKFLIFL